jgi:hypothetical protein
MVSVASPLRPFSMYITNTKKKNKKRYYTDMKRIDYVKGWMIHLKIVVGRYEK